MTKTYKSSTEVEQLLAVERDKVENLHAILGKKRTEIKELKQQLAIEQEKRKEACTNQETIKTAYQRVLNQLLQAQVALAKGP